MAWAIVTAEPPELVKVSDSVWLLPTCTLPKLRLVGFTEIVFTGAEVVTVSVAAALVTVPAVLLTTTENVAPLSALVVTGVV